MRLNEVQQLDKILTNEEVNIMFEKFNMILEGKDNKFREIVNNLNSILNNESPEFAGLTIKIRKSALKSILSKKEKRVVLNVTEFLDEFKNNPDNFENYMLSTGKMRAHKIKHSTKRDVEFDDATKVDIAGKTLGLLFHSGPKNLPTVELPPKSIYIVAFGNHGDLGT
jgi:hypothetical protein